MADRIIIDSTELMSALKKLNKKLTKGDQKEVRALMKRAVRPWKGAVHRSIYKVAERKTGKLSRAMGIGSFVSYRKGIIGAKVRPIGLRQNRQGAGWRIHFFASPAKQMDASKRFPFQEKYQAQTSNVLNRFMQDYTIFVKNTIKGISNA